MVVDRRINPNPDTEEIMQEQVLELENAEKFTPDVEILEDGSAIVGEQERMIDTSFTGNLAESLDDDTLQEISTELIESYEEDKDSRKDWEDSYRKGLDLLGLKYDERSQPFQGASGVTHPMLSESVTQFQAQAYKELLPSGGPVNTQILGKITQQKEEQAQRIKEFMNYQILHVMEEYDPELDQMLFYLPLSGSAFKKIYYDESLERAVSKFVSSDDLYVSYMATDLFSCERITHTIKKSENEIRKLQVAGFYRDIDIKPYNDTDATKEKEDQISGVKKSYQQEEYQLLEVHTDLNIEGVDSDDGIKVPYIVTIDEGSGEVLSIYRNYDEDDPKKKKKQYFTHYKFLPGLGFYGLGLEHMLGGLSRTATSALRQLIDAGTLANLPAGFKARGLRIRDDDNPIQPGEFRDVDAPSGDLRAGLLPLPYKGADPTLFQLLGFVVEAGTRFAAVADQKIGDTVAANAPVGTTMALIERGMRVMSAIHKRLHYAQKIEFNLLAKIFAESLPGRYPYELPSNAIPSIKVQDFSDEIDIIPVSDPNIFSMAQRVTLAQTQLQLAQAAPQMHNMYEAYRRMYQALNVKDIDTILPAPQTPKPVDAGIENAGLLMGKPLIAFKGQNHDAHIEAHKAFFNLASVKNNPQALMTLEAHIMEHVAMRAREQIEQEQAPLIQERAQAAGGQLSPEEQMQVQQELETAVAVRIAEDTAEMVADEQEFLESQGSDPLIDLKQQEINLRAQDLQRKSMVDDAKLGLEQQKLAQSAKISQDKIDSNEDIAQLRANVNLDKQNK
jgi:hypothetical protein